MNDDPNQTNATDSAAEGDRESELGQEPAEESGAGYGNHATGDEDQAGE